MYLNITFLKFCAMPMKGGGRDVQNSSGKARFLSDSISWRLKLCENV